MKKLIPVKIVNDRIILKDANTRKIYERKIKSIDKTLRRFRFDNQDWHVLEVVGESSFTRPFQLNKNTYEAIYGWNIYIEFMKMLVSDWQDYKTADETVPSAPDTSKFYAVKMGDIAWEENYIKHREVWLNPYFFPIIVKVGSAIRTKMPQEFWDEYFSIIAGGLKNELKINNKSAVLRGIHGTAWTAYGLAN